MGFFLIFFPKENDKIEISQIEVKIGLDLNLNFAHVLVF
jgi:hypothetical protein